LHSSREPAEVGAKTGGFIMNTTQTTSGTAENEILERLSVGFNRDIYRADEDGEFWITYGGGGPYTVKVVADLVASGKLVEKYKGCECYCLPNHHP